MKKKHKILISILTLFLTLFIIIISLPFFINLNHFKPQIQKLVSNKINAKIDFSSIKLKLISGIGVKLENVSIENTDPHFLNSKLFEVKEADLNLEFLPLLKGNLFFKIQIDSPNIKLISEKDTNNISSLFSKEKNPAINMNPKIEKSETQNDNLTPTPPSSPEQSYNSLKNITLDSFIINNSNIEYIGNSKLLIKKMDLKASNLGLNKNVKLIISTNIDTKNEEYEINGPIILNLNSEPTSLKPIWIENNYKGDLNLDSLFINYNDIFVKTNKMPFHFSFNGELHPDSFLIKDLMLTLQELDLNLRFYIQNFETLNSNVNLDFSSKDISSLSQLFPKHKALFTEGNFKLTSNIQGLLNKPDTISSSSKFMLNFPNSDINVFFNEDSLVPLKSHLRIICKEFDLGQIIKPLLISKSDINESVLDFNNLKFKNIILNSFAEDHVIDIKSFNLNTINNGSFNSTAKILLNTDPISYSGKIDVKDIAIQEIVKMIKLANNKNPIEGLSNLSFIFSGKGLSQEIISKSLNAKGTFSLKSGKLNMKNILEIASQELKKFLLKIDIKGLNLGFSELEKINFVTNESSELIDGSGEFRIENGKLLINNASTNSQGEIKLDATIGLDESLKGNVLFTANKEVTNNILKKNKNFAYLFDKNNQFKLYITLGGNLSKPEVKIETINLTDNMLHNSTQLIKNEIKKQLKNNPEIQEIQDNAKKLLKDSGLDFGKFGL